MNYTVWLLVSEGSDEVTWLHVPVTGVRENIVAGDVEEEYLPGREEAEKRVIQERIQSKIHPSSPARLHFLEVITSSLSESDSIS